MMQLDEWQQKVLDAEGDIVLRSGRQVGKSTIIAIKASEFAIKNAGKRVLIIASVERQALMLFEKVLGYLADTHKSQIKKGKDRPTKHKITLVNHSEIICVPTGISGYGIRGFTVDLLIADEAAFIPEDVWQAVTPMLATTRGKLILLSTPFGRGGFFYDCFQDEKFAKFHVSSLDCPRIDKAWLERERRRMPRMQYAQEYLGEFVDELRQFFPTEVIRKCMTLEKPEESTWRSRNFLGVDVARMGEDDTVLFSLKKDGDQLIQVGMEISRKTYLTETISAILALDRKHGYRKIYIDDGGLGSGVFDPLLQHPQTRRKVVAINNSARSLDHAENPQRKKLMKEDLYNNLLRIMEQKKIALAADEDIMLSLKSVQYEYDESSGRLKIFGKFTHIAEALVRAAWCTRDKTLNIWIA